MARPPPPQPLPGLCWRLAAFFGAVSAVWVQSAAAVGLEPAPPSAVRPQSPPSGLLLLLLLAALSPTLGLRTAASAASPDPPALLKEEEAETVIEKSNHFSLARSVNNWNRGRPTVKKTFFFKVM